MLHLEKTFPLGLSHLPLFISRLLYLSLHPLPKLVHLLLHRGTYSRADGKCHEAYLAEILQAFTLEDRTDRSEGDLSLNPWKPRRPEIAVPWYDSTCSAAQPAACAWLCDPCHLAIFSPRGGLQRWSRG